ncbi:MAG TPA: DUF1552 domain-containing protein [Polyangiaceae bacterium]|nr:DUF1552 domain-containing protein [Polyangiaceae bacterium]
MSLRIGRRTLLRGLGGAAVGLPLLECMLNQSREARAQSAAPIVRYAIVFAGQALGGDEWERDRYQLAGVRKQETGHFIVPAQTGAGYTLTTPLTPLSALSADFSIVSGLAIPYSKTSTDVSAIPAGGAFRDFHGGGAGPLLCGTRSQSASFACRSITSDQVVAKLHKGKTKLDSLVLRAQPSWYLSGSSFSGRQYISYGDGGAKIEAQTSPQVAFKSLFTGFTPGDAAARAVFDFNQRAQKSVLDLILAKRTALLARVGAADKVRLEKHFDELRALELRAAAVPAPTGACVPPADPGPDPALGGDNAGSGSDTIATNTGYSDEQTRARLLSDLIHMAFVCDLTRVATLQLTVFQSHMNVYPITNAMGTPIRADLHEVGHNGDANNRGQLPVSLCLQWHISHYAYLLQKMKQTQEGDGTLLDHSVMVFMPEAGHGTQLNDATSKFATHSVEDMVLLVAGRAGGLKPGRHIAAAGAHPGQALVSCMQAAGSTATALGEVPGNLPALFG